MAVEALWRTATANPAEKEFVHCMTCLTTLGDKAEALAKRELDGPHRELARALLDRIASEKAE